MKNKLFIFGDSMSTNFTTTNEVEIDESWPVLLSKKLNLELKNYSIIGASNGEIINKFFEIYKEINSNDVIIIQIGFWERIHDNFKNTTVLLGYGKEDKFSKIEMDYYKYKILDPDEYITQDIIKFAFIVNYLKKIGCNVYGWMIDKEIPSKYKRAYAYMFGHLKEDFKKNFIRFKDTYSCMDGFIEPNSKYWCHTGDKHFNKVAHSNFFQYLYQYIQLKNYEI
jgi:hypothetical protein